MSVLVVLGDPEEMDEAKYQVECSCGVSVPVRSGQAGSAIDCRCGRQIAVPRLAQLRKSAGESAYGANSMTAIRRAFNEGELPGSECACCQGHADKTVRCYVVCERSYRVRQTDGSEVSYIAFLLLGPLWFLLTLPFLSWRKSHVESYGRDTGIELCLPVCHGCLKGHGNFRRKRLLKRCLREVSQYDRLFKDYPGAAICNIAVDEGMLS